MRPTAESVRLHLLLVAFAAAVIAGGCGEGNVLESPTAPSSTLTASAALTGDGDAAAMASSAGEAAVLKKGGGNGNGNAGGNGNGNGGGNGNENGGGNGNGNGGDPGRSHEAKVVGFVSARSGDTLTVRGTDVVAGSGAVVRHGHRILTMADIQVGDHVQARGEMDGATLVAVEIKVQDTDRDNDGDGDDDDEDDGDETELEGTISALSSTGNCPAVTFMIGSTKVTTSASTTFDDVSCVNLANNARVEVEGIKQSDGSVLATEVELRSGPDEVEGTVFEFSGSGSCPSATFKVGATAMSATKVTTTNSTTFSGVSCATLTNGAKVEVEGNKQGDGSIIAASVELK